MGTIYIGQHLVARLDRAISGDYPDKPDNDEILF